MQNLPVGWGDVKSVWMICRGQPECRPVDFGPMGAKIHNIRIRRTCQETWHPVLRNGTQAVPYIRS